MPTYEYECQKCGKVFDVFQSMTEAPVKKCQDPKCKGKVQRLIGAGAGLIFKGSGFYQTDYKNSGGSKSESSSASSSTETKSESKSESKSETKTDSGGGGCAGGACGCH